MEILLLIPAGFLAGAMNAIAGGGSFVNFPAMVALGMPALYANASSTVALMPASLASTWAYTTGKHRMPLVNFGRLPFWVMLLASLAGGLTGALLLLGTPPGLFDVVIPWLLLAATAVFVFGGRLSQAVAGRMRLPDWVAAVIQFVLGIYGGYFGGAVGLMTLAAWSLLGVADLKALNPVRTLLVATMNAIAVVCFIIAGAVWWPQTLASLAGALVGGYVGGRIGQRLPLKVVRGAVILLSVVVTVSFFKRAYWHG